VQGVAQGWVWWGRFAGGRRVAAGPRTAAAGGAARRPGRGRRRHRRLGPSSSATTSTTERALPSSAVQARCWSRPTTTTRLPLREGPARVLGLVAPDDHGEERRLLLSSTRDGHPEHGPGDAAVGVADLRVVDEVPAKLMLASVMVLPLSGAWPGGLPCPWTRGRWTPWHAKRPKGASRGANEVGPTGSTAPSVLGSGAGLVGRRARGWAAGAGR
jgi:hypothetical protein